MEAVSALVVSNIGGTTSEAVAGPVAHPFPRPPDHALGLLRNPSP